VKITLACVGVKQPGWAAQAVEEYLKRFPAEFAVSVKPVKPAARTGTPSGRVKAEEAARLLAACPKETFLVAMDEHGKAFTSEAFAAWLAKTSLEHPDVSFVIGGADGLDDGLLKAARAKVSLSAMTLPHALARLVLVEQLYRAYTILKGHPYHRE